MIMKRLLQLKWLHAGIFTLMVSAFALGQDTNTNTSCATALPVCPDNNFGLNIPSEIGSQNTADEAPGTHYGCNLSQPNPLWYYMRVSQTGTAIFDLTQYTEMNQQGDGLDVDFTVWGPFEDENACGMLTEDMVIDSSYDPTAFEVIDFYSGDGCGPEPTENPQQVNAGEVYIIMITNFSRRAGYINLIPRDEMTATFDCSILGPTYSFCDYDGDGTETVNLEDYISEINGGDNNIGVTFHSTSQGAYNYTDIVSNTQTFSLGEDLTIFARKENFLTSEVEVVIITFNLIPKPEMEDTTISYCDNNGDGVEVFDLTAANVNPNPDQELALSYFTSQEDADAEENAIEDPTYYESGSTVIYVRGEAGNCYSTATITLDVVDGIELTSVEDSVCDLDGDELHIFNLSNYSSQILGTYQGEIKFYENEADAIAGNDNFITNIDAYETGSTVLYASVHTDGGCKSTATLTLNVLATPQLSDVTEPYVYCDLWADGTETVDLTQAFADVVESTTGFTATYYLNETDAIAGNENSISTPNAYDLTSTTTFYINVSAGDCSDVASFTIELTEGISVSDVTLNVCYSDSGSGTFDLTSADVSSVGTVSYYTSESNAMNGTNPIENALGYTTNVPSTVYALVEEGECKSIAEINLAYFAAPNIDIPSEVSICSGYSEIVDAGSNFTAYEWSTGETTQTIEVDELGAYWVDLTDTNGCTFRHEFNVVPGSAPDITSVEVGQDSFTITAEGGVEPYQYSIGGFIFQDSNVFSNLYQGEYNLYVRGADGCVSEVEIASILSWPDLFTPNGDGINDTWRVPGLNIYPGSSVRIFDRYGALIYQGLVSSNDLWDGRDLSGNKVSSQDYWYVIEVTDGRVYSGHVTVKNRTEKGQ